MAVASLKSGKVSKPSKKTMMAVASVKNGKVLKPSKNTVKKSWQKVKIKGNVISDLTATGLEGLIGLEVLEKYDRNLVTKEKKKRFPKREVIETKRSHGGSSDSEASFDEEGRQKRKKTKTKKKPEKHSQTPGRFVLLKPPKKDGAESDEEEQANESEKPKEKVALETDDLIGWNGLGVPDVVLKAIAENGFKSPTQIQSLTLPAAIMGKKDILGAAETGSGKTLAFGIPILAGIMELRKKNLSTGIRKSKKVATNKVRKDRDNLTPPPEEVDNFPDSEDNSEVLEDEKRKKRRKKPLYALILTPTRELAVQVKDHLVSAARYTDIQVAAIFGGLAAVKQERVLRQCPEIIVATPGRLWELLEQGNPHLQKIDDISFLVIDETDRMVERGHFEELRLLLKRLNTDESKKEKRQNFVFSATLTMVHDIPDHLKKKNISRKAKFAKPTSEVKVQSLIEELGISQPKIVDITRTQQTAQTLMESRIICPMDQKDYYLYYILQKHPGRTVVFCNSIESVKRLAQIFGLLNCQPLPLHAQMIQKQRLKNLERFRDNPQGLLIATDVAARGLDIPNIQHVIHYQVPRTSENYVHRSGRTARANKDGITILIMEPGEVRNYLKICQTLGRQEDLSLFPVAERFLKAVKERVNLARDVDKLDLKFRRKQSEMGWWKKNAEEIDMVLDGESESERSDNDDGNPAIIETRRNKMLLQSYRQQLQALLNKPLFPKGFTYKYPTSTGKLEVPLFEHGLTDDNSAVNAMKHAIEEYKKDKKKKKKKPISEE